MMAVTPAHRQAWLLLLCLAASVGSGAAARGSGRRWGRGHRPASARGTAGFVTHHRGNCRRSKISSLERRDGDLMQSLDQRHRRQILTIRNSPGDGDDGPESRTDDTIEPPANPPSDDPDGVPLFDTYERATLFGLEPKAELDPLDNGLQFTGPIALLLSVYVTLSLFFADDMPPLDL